MCKNTRRSCWVKKGRTRAWWDKFLTNEVPESEWRDNFRVSERGFSELCKVLRLWLQRKNTGLRRSISIQAQVGLYLYCISSEGRYRNANAWRFTYNRLHL